MTPDGYTFVAAADLSAKRYHIMRVIDNAKGINIASLATHSSMIGVLQDAPISGQHGSVAFQGVGNITLGAAVNSLVWVTSNGSGRAVAATSGQMVCGRLLETGGADGQVVKCLYVPPFRLSGAV